MTTARIASIGDDLECRATPDGHRPPSHAQLVEIVQVVAAALGEEPAVGDENAGPWWVVDAATGFG
jgi:hypothetical protein